MSHDMIQHMDGMDQVDLDQSMCTSHLHLYSLLLTCLIAHIDHEPFEGCTLSGGALDQI